MFACMYKFDSFTLESFPGILKFADYDQKSFNADGGKY